MRRRWIAFALAGLMAGCTGDVSQRQGQRMALFIGIDVSGSFYHSKYYDDSLDFLSHYIYGHLNNAENLYVAKELFVGPIGGNSKDQMQSFHRIYDFQDKTPEQIKAQLKLWYPKSDNISDFSVFFKQVAGIAHERNLSLMPITIVMVSDGIPALPGPGDRPDVGHYSKIDISPLEYTSRNVTIRLLYADPTVSDKWKTEIARTRVKIWTVDSQVLTGSAGAGWKNQLQPNVAEIQQTKLWNWIQDIVDFRVISVKFQNSKRGKR